MKEFDDLLATLEALFAPNGCPWDREQTMASTRPCVIEEASELIDAIDSNDPSHIQEELGDFIFVGIYLSKLADKEKKANLKEVLKLVNEKLIRRHPHVFGNVKIEDSSGVVKQWEEIKKTEKGKTLRKSILDGIPKGLPALARAQKVHKKIREKKFNEQISNSEKFSFNSEEELGTVLYNLVSKAQEKGLDAEHALRKTLIEVEQKIRAQENQP